MPTRRRNHYAGVEAEAAILDRQGVALDADQLPADAEARCQSFALRDRGHRLALGAVAVRRRPRQLSALSGLHHENHLPVAWAVGAFYVEQGKNAFMRFYDFLESIPAHVLVPLFPAAGAQSDLILSVIPYSVETNRMIFAIADYDLGFHNRIG
jgi:hypothetical protein